MSYFAEVSLKDNQSGKIIKIDPQRQLASCQPVRLVGSTFQGTTKDTNFWTETTAAAGAVTQASNQITLATGVVANGAATYTSNQATRYIAGSANFFRSVVQLPDTGTANNIRAWGAFLATDGAFFELNGTTFNVVTRIGSADTRVAAAAFNTATFTMDTNIHTYEIWYTNPKVWFYIDDVLRHVVSATTAQAVGTFSLKVSFSNTNASGSVSNVLVNVRVASIYRFGSTDPSPVFYNVAVAETRVLKYGPGHLRKVIIGGPGSNSATLNIYDNTAASGSKIAALNINNTATTACSIDFDTSFATGLTYITVGTTVPSITFVYE